MPLLRRLARERKVAAIGEIGLDYYWDKEHKALQQEMFERQIHLALELDLPVIVHDRQAHEDCLEMVLALSRLAGRVPLLFRQRPHGPGAGAPGLVPGV